MKKIIALLLLAAATAQGQPLLRLFTTTNTPTITSNIILSMVTNPTNGTTATQVSNIVSDNAILKVAGVGTNTSIFGTLTNAAIASHASTLTLTAAGSTLEIGSSTANFGGAGGFSGVGVNLTELNASELDSGSVPTGRLTNAIIRTNGTGYGTTIKVQTNWPSIANADNGTWLRLESTWYSNTTYNAPFNLWQSWTYQDTFDHDHPDVGTGFGYNDGLGGVQNPNEPSLSYYFENRWQNGNLFEQSEWYLTSQTPTNGYGTNFAWRFIGLDTVWNINRVGPTNQGYVSSSLSVEADSFTLSSPSQNVNPFVVNLSPGAAGVIVNGTQTINTNGAGSAGLDIFGGAVRIGAPAAWGQTMRLFQDWGNSSYSLGTNHYYIVPSTTTRILNIGQNATQLENWMKINLNTNVEVTGTLIGRDTITATNGFSSRSNLFTMMPTNSPTDGYSMVAAGTAGHTKWANVTGGSGAFTGNPNQFTVANGETNIVINALVTNMLNEVTGDVNFVQDDGGVYWQKWNDTLDRWETYGDKVAISTDQSMTITTNTLPLNDALIVNGNTTMNGDLAVNGNSTFNTATATVMLANSIYPIGITNALLASDSNGKLAAASASYITNIPIVSSFAVPMGAWSSNNTSITTMTPASAVTYTNTGDAFTFADAITNTIMFRGALPIDWNAGTVKFHLTVACGGTNHSSAVGSVWGLAASATTNYNSPTFGTEVLVTNTQAATITSAYETVRSITTAITVGGSPVAGNDVLWRLRRMGGMTGDTITNTPLYVVGTSIELQRNTTSAFSTSTP